MKSIIIFTSVLLSLTGCGDSTRFSSSSENQNTMLQEKKPGKTSRTSKQADAEVSSEKVSSSQSVGIEDENEMGFEEGLIPEKPSSKISHSDEKAASEQTADTPPKSTPIEQVPSSETGSDQIQKEITAAVPKMLSSQASNLNQAQQQALEQGLIDLSKSMMSGAAAGGPGSLTQVIDLAKKVNSLKSNFALAGGLDLGAQLPANLPVDLPALADAAVLADFAAALADLAAAAVALDVAGILDAIQDIIDLIMDLIA